MHRTAGTSGPYIGYVLRLADLPSPEAFPSWRPYDGQVVGRYKALATYGTVGLELSGSILLGLFGGRWLDGKLGTEGFALAGFGLGLVTGFRFLWQALKSAQKEAAAEEAAERRLRDD